MLSSRCGEKVPRKCTPSGGSRSARSGCTRGVAAGLTSTGCCLFHRLVDKFEPAPASAVARQLDPCHAVLKDLLDVRGVEHRKAVGRHYLFAVVRDGGRLAGVVVSEHGEDAALGVRSRVVAVLDRVARPIYPKALAVPDGEHTVHGRFADVLQLLRAPHRSGGQVLVDARFEHHVGLLQGGGRLPQGLIDPSQRRAAASGDIARGVQAGRSVELASQEQQSHEGLGTVEQHLALVRAVTVFEPDIQQRGFLSHANAVHSISTSNARGQEPTATKVRAGGSLAKNSP